MNDAIDQAQRQGAEAIVITEKDAVKIPQLNREALRAKSPVPVYVVSVEVTFQKGNAEFLKLLKAELERKIKEEK